MTGDDPRHNVSDEEWADLVARMRGDDDGGILVEPEPASAGRPPEGEQPSDPEPDEMDPGRSISDDAGPGEVATGKPSDDRSKPAADRFDAAEADDDGWDDIKPASSVADDVSEPDAAEDKFEPPEPPEFDLSSTSPLLVLSWFCALASPAYIVVVALFWRAAPTWTIGLGIALFVAGVTGLLWHLPTKRDNNDDGAVV
ncbi:hypothetical protein LWF01_07085 [Saxibacter everestensis]|uniref:DUF2530 domain-containing protein n=1 Tax=Saxibacter everestensis TaxID=2909229 RepID=A0ABY8QX14_9MICO|nr:hypothetical protein LWF01_07085 [Brevibacteriaceae bacterium ZFBP1038]